MNERTLSLNQNYLSNDNRISSSFYCNYIPSVVGECSAAKAAARTPTTAEKQIYERADQNNSSIKIKKGTLELIRQILGSFDNPIIPVEIVLVHPGLKTQNLTTGQLEAFTRIKYLFSAADTYMEDVSSCQLSIMCS